MVIDRRPSFPGSRAKYTEIINGFAADPPLASDIRKVKGGGTLQDIANGRTRIVPINVQDNAYDPSGPHVVIEYTADDGTWRSQKIKPGPKIMLPDGDGVTVKFQKDDPTP